MLMRVYVDFEAVEPAHQAIDARLRNWARWCRGRGGAQCSPAFRLYRSTDQWATEYAAATVTRIDGADATKMQRAVVALPQRHRQALGWCYVTQGPPHRAARALGESLQGLADLVRDGRQMLVVRGR